MDQYSFHYKSIHSKKEEEIMESILKFAKDHDPHAKSPEFYVSDDYPVGTGLSIYAQLRDGVLCKEQHGAEGDQWREVLRVLVAKDYATSTCICQDGVYKYVVTYKGLEFIIMKSILKFAKDHDPHAKSPEFYVSDDYPVGTGLSIYAQLRDGVLCKEQHGAEGDQWREVLRVLVAKDYATSTCICQDGVYKYVVTYKGLEFIMV